MTFIKGLNSSGQQFDDLMNFMNLRNLMSLWNLANLANLVNMVKQLNMVNLCSNSGKTSKTQCQDEFRILSGRTQKLKVAKRCWKQ